MRSTSGDLFFANRSPGRQLSVLLVRAGVLVSFSSRVLLSLAISAHGVFVVSCFSPLACFVVSVRWFLLVGLGLPPPPSLLLFSFLIFNPVRSLCACSPLSWGISVRRVRRDTPRRVGVGSVGDPRSRLLSLGSWTDYAHAKNRSHLWSFVLLWRPADRRACASSGPQVDDSMLRLDRPLCLPVVLQDTGVSALSSSFFRHLFRGGVSFSPLYGASSSAAPSPLFLPPLRGLAEHLEQRAQVPFRAHASRACLEASCAQTAFRLALGYRLIGAKPYLSPGRTCAGRCPSICRPCALCAI